MNNRSERDVPPEYDRDGFNLSMRMQKFIAISVAVLGTAGFIYAAKIIYDVKNPSPRPLGPTINDISVMPSQQADIDGIRITPTPVFDRGFKQLWR